VTVVSGYEVQAAVIEDSVATIEVTYDVVGGIRPTVPPGTYVFDQSFAGRHVVSFTVVETDAGWRIASPLLVPHISVSDALQGFARVLSEEDVAKLRRLLPN
jgi:hypothetical protein